MRLIFILIITLTTLLSGGCGWHLRGTLFSAELPFKTVIIAPDDPFDPVYKQLRHSLQAKKIKVISKTAPCPDLCSDIPCIIILEHHFTEQPFVYGSDGEIRREKLFFEMHYQYKNITRKIVTRRFWQININHNLANMAEKEIIKKEMILDAVQQLLVQLNANPG